MCRPAWDRCNPAIQRSGTQPGEKSPEARQPGGLIVSESSNNPPADTSGIGEAVTTALRQPSFLRVMLVLASTVVVLVGIRLSAPILNPIFFAVVLSLLFSPIYSWLKRRGLPAPLALLIMLVMLTVLFVGLFFIMGASIARFSERVGFYTTQLNGQLVNLDALIERLGLSNVDLRDVVKPSALADSLGVVLSGIAGFLSDLFLILMIMLFLLGEGPAIMNRLRASVSEDNTQVARLTTVGQSVVRQFGLRAIVNLVTGAGVTVLLFVLGVDFPVLWGILTFFLSFVPYIGLVLAVAPAVVLALAEFGVTRAIVVIAGVVVINVLAENVLSPMMMGRGLNLSPTVVFLSFIVWAWLLGGPGAFLAVPITLFVAVMFDTFPETRWLASIIGVRSSDTEAAGGPAAGTPAPGAEAEGAP
jgi:AI-2 transport protein TqsA